jgi:N6-L-threonylcarbamoyladenine synthase
MVLLAIETSCDDTSVALFRDKKLLSGVTLSSTDLHKKYGGIIPEIAARQHERNILPCLNECLRRSKVNIKNITHIAYTSEPGLPGSLHIGKVFAKSLSTLLNAKLIKVNHLCGHAYSFALTSKTITYPFISLIVSGGETAIVLFKNKTKYIILNKTCDDAVGETLDKVGRKLSLSYPGGKSIDEIYDNNKTNLKLINHFKPEQPFSFSGFKTHILNLINNKNKMDKVTIASSSLK